MACCRHSLNRAVYRVFSGRGELLEAAIVARMHEIVDSLHDEWERHPTFADAFVETSIARRW
jgi:hypothetical protein